MSKRIIVLNGSPRKNGNTSAMVEAFTRGAEESGNVVDCYFLDDMTINGCKGCYGGGRDPESPCVQKDDMDAIYPVYREADIVVLASPLYYWNLSGQLVTTINRLYAVAESREPRKNPPKNSILLMAAGGYGFEEITNYYNSLLERISWTNLGMILAGDVGKPGDIAGRPELEQAYQLGKSIA